MQRRRTAASLAEKRLHRLEHFRQDRRGRLMIEKNAAHGPSNNGSRMFDGLQHPKRSLVSHQVIPFRRVSSRIVARAVAVEVTRRKCSSRQNPPPIPKMRLEETLAPALSPRRSDGERIEVGPVQLRLGGGWITPSHFHFAGTADSFPAEGTGRLTSRRQCSFSLRSSNNE